jgi:Mn2+/Fe2+ NRAMP family transporter
MKEPEPEDAVPDADSAAAVHDAVVRREGEAKQKHGDGFAALVMWSVMAAYAAVLAIAIIASHSLGMSSGAQYGLIVLAMITMTLLLPCVVALIVYFTSKTSADAQERRRPLVAGLLFGAGVVLGITWMVFLVGSSGGNGSGR